MLQVVLETNDINALRDTGLHAKLAAYINALIVNHFDELMNLLYRLDVSEQKVKALVKENSEENAGALIATLIIERQVQKIKSREEYKRDTNISDEEKW